MACSPSSSSSSSDDEKSSESSTKCANAFSIAFRIAGMGLAVAAAALMATASSCTIYIEYGVRPRTVTYSNYGPYVFLVIANSMAAFLGAIAVFLSVWKKGKNKKARVLMPLLGAAVPAMLYSATAAAFVTSNDMNYCSAYGNRVSICAGSAAGGSSNFCRQARVAIFLSLGAAVAWSVAEVVRSLPLSMSFGGGGSDSGSSSSSESGGGCEHGCHHKH